MDFVRVEDPLFFPSMCLCCGSPEGPLVDTLVEKHGVGRIYVCFRCAHEASRKLGGLPPVERTELEGRVEWLEQQLAEAEQARDEAVASRVVSIDDLALALRDQAQRGAILTPILRGMDS